MSYTEKWNNTFESRNKDSLSEQLDDEFVFVRHQSCKEVSSEEMLNIRSTYRPHVYQKVLQKNIKIRTYQLLIDSLNGKREKVLGVMNLKNGRGIRMDTGAIPMPQKRESMDIEICSTYVTSGKGIKTHFDLILPFRLNDSEASCRV